MTSPNPARDEAVAPDVLAKQVADAASDMCEIARIVGEWRHGPKQSLTAVREIRACLAAKPPAIGVDAVVEAMENDPFWQDAPLAGTTEQDQRIRHYAEVALASLSPAATSGSEAGGEAAKAAWQKWNETYDPSKDMMFEGAAQRGFLAGWAAAKESANDRC